MKSIELSVWTPAQAGRLLLNPPKKKPRTITIEYPMPEKQVRELLTRCASPELRLLSLEGVALREGKAWGRTLAPFTALKELDLVESFADGASALEWLAQVRLRGLRRLRITAVDLSAVVSELSTHVVKRLEPSLNELGVFGASLDGHHAARLFRGLSLKLVGLGDNPLGIEGLRHLASALDITRLSEIALPACGLGDEGMKLVAFWLAGRRLEHVFLGTNGITARGASEIGRRWSSNLSGSLLLPRNPLGADGISVLSAALRTVRWIDLSDSAIDREAVKRLSATAMPKLRELEVDRNELGDSGVLPLRGAAWLPKLRALNITQNDLSARSIRPIVQTASSRCAIQLEDGNRVSKATLESLRKRNEGLL